jgi:long-chain acyl-CoA synthetase
MTARRTLRVVRISGETHPYRTELTPVSFLRRSAYVFPDKTAIVHGSRRYTYREFEERANRLASGLRELGLRHLDRVAIIAPNTPAMLEAHFGVPAAGLVLVPINIRLNSDEIGYILKHSGSKVLLVDHESEAVVKPLDLTALRVIRIDDTGAAGDPYEDFLALASPEPGETWLEDEFETISINYTSGTTGRPKGVHRTDNQAISRRTMPATDYRPGESMHLCTGPLYHAAPLAFSLAGPLLGGVGIVLMDGWSPSETLRLIERHRITHTHMVPTMFHRLLALPEDERAAADVSSVRYILHGAAPCPVAIKQAIIEWFGPVVVEYYAATEGSGTYVASEEWLTKPGTVGRPYTADHVRIIGPDGEDVPRGEVGTIYLKAPERGRFDYFKDPEKTAGSYLGDHFTMGDVGYLDEDGYLFLTDRSANLIISGGVNIYPAEVEEALWPHPAVADVAVIGVPDPDWGETVLAAVQVRPGVVADDRLAAELIELCRERLARYKCPRRIDFVDSLPRTDAGKLYKRRLRDQYRAAYAAAQSEGEEA